MNRSAVIGVVSMVFGLAACSSTMRLNDDFNGEVVGAAPLKAPQPNPPADTASWSTIKSASRIVARPRGGNWAEIQPTAAYFGGPGSQNSAGVLVADSETFTSNPSEIRGGVSFSLVGNGKVDFIVEALGQQGTSQGEIGGVEVVSTDLSASLASLNEQQIQIHFGGTGFGNYQRGSVVRASWSIDPASKVFNVTVTGGSPQNMRFSAPTPIVRLRLNVVLIDATSDTRLFVDDLSMDEPG